ncbi:Leucine-rich repeat receptor-like protein kinase [Corchorus olitorius]|uniref:Leucine-rich repeat receptor-like protein kinase n=1 Tax=Corchorus olitorius TaxID=93759 RepID=A0A1R3IVR5_9ROSI|nr:Leucine-rich repeat receptor-like protein kinase [Corchorus olitorius]
MPSMDAAARAAHYRKFEEPLLERMLTSLFSTFLWVCVYVCWRLGPYEIIEFFAFNYKGENGREIFEKTENALRVLLVANIVFLIKGAMRPGNGRKGSAQKELNLILNTVLSIITIIALFYVLGVIDGDVIAAAVFGFSISILLRCIKMIN